MRIGVMTLFHKSYNYGGLLQAYALTNYINRLFGTQVAEQIVCEFSYEKRSFSESMERLKGCSLWAIISKIVEKVKKYIFKLLQPSSFQENLKKRREKCENFRNFVPHSQVISEYKIDILNQQYDLFISGSDQVWNPTLIKKAYFLDFVLDEKKKVSYAASMSVNELRKKKADILIPLIERFDWISVREKSAKEILDRYINDKEIQVVLDPVFLLQKKEWNKIAKSSIQKKEYLYSYFLGDNKKNRKISKEIAKKIGLPIVTVPYIHMEYNWFDKNYGDILLYDIGPAEFVGLIKDAKAVVTDSFHGLVFSIIYHKKFFCFKRDKDSDSGSMNSRIVDLLEELGLKNRFITSVKQITEEFLTEEIDYIMVEQILKKKRNASIYFLNHAIEADKIENK